MSIREPAETGCTCPRAAWLGYANQVFCANCGRDLTTPLANCEPPRSAIRRALTRFWAWWTKYDGKPRTWLDLLGP
jgi:hypothetical protein